jgi:hypothetical protein
MKHRNSHLLIGYWSRIRRGRDLPEQADIDPRAIKRMLPQVFILDGQDRARPAYRLAGTVLCERFDLELKGTSFFAHWEHQAHGTLALLVGQALAAKQPVCLSAIGVTARAATIEMETVLAPLAVNGAPQRLLGITQFLGDAAQLSGRPIIYERLMGSKMIREDDSAGRRSADPPLPPPGCSIAARAPHLRLVVSRGERVTLHSEMDDTMRRLVRALDIAPAARQSH